MFLSDKREFTLEIGAEVEGIVMGTERKEADEEKGEGEKAEAEVEVEAMSIS